MNDSFYEFCQVVGNPSWVCFACLITGFIAGFGFTFISAAAGEVYEFFKSTRPWKCVEDTSKK